jgi:hypothetical protein
MVDTCKHFEIGSGSVRSLSHLSVFVIDLFAIISAPAQKRFRTQTCPIPLQTNVYIGYVDYVMAKRENLNKLNLSLLKTLTLKEELVKEI